MNDALKSLLKPEVLHTVDGLELVARIIVEGFISGSNKSQSTGVGQEFSQYRGYEPGDDLRQLDWKMYARSERYYIKQADIETNITVKLVLDTSRSMAYSEGGVSKLQYARVLCAALAYLARKQSDSFGLYTINAEELHVVQPRFEHQQFFRFLHELLRANARGTWSRDTAPEKLIGYQGKDLLIFFTDLYDDQDDLYRFVTRLKTARNEVIVFHLLARAERDFAYGDAFTFEDLETGQRVKVNARDQQAAYAQRVDQWIADSRDRLLEKGVTYQLVSMDDDPARVLQQFLTARKKLLR